MRVAALRPKTADMVKLFGADSTVTMPDGEQRIYYRRPDLSPAQNQRRAAQCLEAFAPSRRLDCEISYERSERMAKTQVRRHDGRIDLVPLEQEARIARKAGVSAVRSWSRVPLSNREGHTHAGAPQPWHLRSCPGCVDDALDEAA